MPRKIYTKRYFKLTDKQRKVYDKVKEDYIIELDNQQFSVPMALTRLMKLQQITSNFVVTIPDHTNNIDSVNPRLNLLLEIIDDALPDESFIVWCRFRYDIDVICKALTDKGISNVRYDGMTNTEQRADNLLKFQNKKARVFVANPATAAEGLNLYVSSNVVYYSNSFKYGDRNQSEDRAHRIGQTENVLYYDLIAEKTLDSKIIKVLINKQELAYFITGDNFREWL